MIIRRSITVLLVLSLLPVVAAGELLDFGPASMRVIETTYSGTPFVVAIWATDCPPCRRELALLSKFSDQHPDVSIVLIATDGPGAEGNVQKVLESYNLDAAETWNFGDAGTDRLRHAIDPRWYGELPRSYFYDASSDRVGISGALTEDLLGKWLAD